MAIIRCRECGADVSSRAGGCPQCGVDTPSQSTYNWNSCLNVLGYIFATLVVLSLVASR